MDLTFLVDTLSVNYNPAKISWQYFFKISSRRLQGVLCREISAERFFLAACLQDLFKIFLEKDSSCQHIFKASSRRIDQGEYLENKTFFTRISRYYETALKIC